MRPGLWFVYMSVAVFQSTHSCAECDPLAMALPMVSNISIHAFLCGMRPSRATCSLTPRHFNPRIPVRNATSQAFHSHAYRTVFQSTHSCAECDHDLPRARPRPCYFNPRIPVRNATISTISSPSSAENFNPRIPVRNATSPFRSSRWSVQISIHAFLCGMRRESPSSPARVRYFNPRIPVRNATEICHSF